MVIRPFTAVLISVVYVSRASCVQVHTVRRKCQVDWQIVKLFNRSGQRVLTIHHFYNPPKNHMSFPPELDIHSKTLIVGDLNAHSPLWGYKERNKSGEAVEDFVQSNPLVLLNSPTSQPTLMHYATKKQFSPDLDIVTGDILAGCERKVLEDIGSDHLPTLLSVEIESNQTVRNTKCRPNFWKANWGLFAKTSDMFLNKLSVNDLSVEQASKKFTYCLTEATKRAVPKGRPRDTGQTSLRNFLPKSSSAKEQGN